jgi:hypothetical protein
MKNDYNLLEIGNMYVVVNKLYCLKKKDINLNRIDILYDLETEELLKNSLIMFLGKRTIDKTGACYSLILTGKEMYYTYNPKMLSEYIKPL